MFKINLTPQFSDATLILSKAGDVLTVNGDALDFSDLPEGGEYPADAIDNEHVVGGACRHDGSIIISILMPYNNRNAPVTVTHPSPLVVNQDGDIALPEGREMLMLVEEILPIGDEEPRDAFE